MSISVHHSLRRGKALTLAGLLLAAYPASLALSALGYQFRPVTEVRQVASTPMKTQDGAEIALVSRLTTHWFFLPYAIRADGLALQVKGKAEPVALDTTQIRGLQSDRLLPEPLPSVALTWGDRVLGNMLWILLLPLLGWIGLRQWRGMGNARATASVKPTPQVPIERIAPRSAAQASAAEASKPAPVPSQPPAAEQATTQATAPAAARVAVQAPRAPAAAPCVPMPTATPKAPAAAPKPSTSPPAKSASFPEARIKCRVKSLKAA